MQRNRTVGRRELAVSVLAVVAISGLILRAAATTATSQQDDAWSGRVVSTSGGGAASGPPVAGATVHLVPVTAVDTTTRMTASAVYARPYPAERYDEPLEDAIRQRGADFPRAVTDARGNFVVARVPEGRFFMHVTPAPQDLEHLPGGDQSRRSRSAAQLRGASTTITVSSGPSPTARVVGSSRCLPCHQDQRHWQQTAHKLGWTVPGAPGAMQDFSRHPGYFDALDAFPEVDRHSEGTHLEVGDYDARRNNDKFTVRGAGDMRVPMATVYADVYLWRSRDDGTYYITVANRLNQRDPNSPAHLAIRLLYGGAVHDQRYIVAAPPALGDRPGWYTVLRYNMTGRDNRLTRTRRVWGDYKLDLWWSAGADGLHGTADDAITAPPINTNTVQTMCASCHVTGWERYEDAATGQLLVRAVDDPAGAMNIDDDPAMDEINIGCENCHGAGSEHVAAAERAATVATADPGAGRFIVNPRHLSAARASVVCGRCHDRRQGYGGPTAGYTQALSATGGLAQPGISRHELITEYTDPVKKGPTMGGPGRGNDIWPDDVHSRTPHQQYSDFLKSTMYRNDRWLVTCSDCHDLHGGTPYPRWLIHDPDDPTSPLCQRCHTVDVLSHMDTKLNARMKGLQTRCIDCHMPGTANTGGIAGSFGRMIDTPPYASAAEEEANAYWESPINSHVFDVPLKTNVAVDGVPPGRAMPIPYTAACGTCHVVDEMPFK